MWHKPCRTFHPWCLCIKTRCLSCKGVPTDLEQFSQMRYVCLKYDSCDISYNWVSIVVGDGLEPICHQAISTPMMMWIVDAHAQTIMTYDLLSMRVGSGQHWVSESWGGNLDDSGVKINRVRPSVTDTVTAVGPVLSQDCTDAQITENLRKNCTFCLVPFLRWLGHVYSWSNFISGSFLTTNYHNVLCCSPSYQVEQRGVRVSQWKLFFLEIFCCINSTGLPFRAVINSLICHEEAS